MAIRFLPSRVDTFCLYTGIEKQTGASAMRIVFQINPDGSCPNNLANSLGDVQGPYTVSSLDVGSYRHRDTGGDNGDFVHHRRASDTLPVPHSTGIGDARARRPDRFETRFL